MNHLLEKMQVYVQLSNCHEVFKASPRHEVGMVFGIGQYLNRKAAPGSLCSTLYYNAICDLSKIIREARGTEGAVVAPLQHFKKDDVAEAYLFFKDTAYCAELCMNLDQHPRATEYAFYGNVEHWKAGFDDAEFPMVLPVGMCSSISLSYIMACSSIVVGQVHDAKLRGSWWMLYTHAANSHDTATRTAGRVHVDLSEYTAYIVRRVSDAEKTNISATHRSALRDIFDYARAHPLTDLLTRCSNIEDDLMMAEDAIVVDCGNIPNQDACSDARSLVATDIESQSEKGFSRKRQRDEMKRVFLSPRALETVVSQYVARAMCVDEHRKLRCATTKQPVLHTAHGLLVSRVVLSHDGETISDAAVWNSVMAFANHRPAHTWHAALYNITKVKGMSIALDTKYQHGQYSVEFAYDERHYRDVVMRMNRFHMFDSACASSHCVTKLQIAWSANDGRRHDCHSECTRAVLNLSAGPERTAGVVVFESARTFVSMLGSALYAWDNKTPASARVVPRQAMLVPHHGSKLCMASKSDVRVCVKHAFQAFAPLDALQSALIDGRSISKLLAQQCMGALGGCSTADVERCAAWCRDNDVFPAVLDVDAHVRDIVVTVRLPCHGLCVTWRDEFIDAFGHCGRAGEPWCVLTSKAQQLVRVTHENVLDLRFYYAHGPVKQVVTNKAMFRDPHDAVARVGPASEDVMFVGLRRDNVDDTAFDLESGLVEVDVLISSCWCQTVQVLSWLKRGYELCSGHVYDAARLHVTCEDNAVKVRRRGSGIALDDLYGALLNNCEKEREVGHASCGQRSVPQGACARVAMSHCLTMRRIASKCREYVKSAVSDIRCGKNVETYRHVARVLTGRGVSQRRGDADDRQLQVEISQMWAHAYQVAHVDFNWHWFSKHGVVYGPLAELSVGTIMSALTLKDTHARASGVTKPLWHGTPRNATHSKRIRFRQACAARGPSADALELQLLTLSQPCALHKHLPGEASPRTIKDEHIVRVITLVDAQRYVSVFGDCLRRQRVFEWSTSSHALVQRWVEKLPSYTSTFESAVESIRQLVACVCQVDALTGSTVRSAAKRTLASVKALSCSTVMQQASGTVHNRFARENIHTSKALVVTHVRQAHVRMCSWIAQAEIVRAMCRCTQSMLETYAGVHDPALVLECVPFEMACAFDRVVCEHNRQWTRCTEPRWMQHRSKNVLSTENVQMMVKGVADCAIGHGEFIAAVAIMHHVVCKLEKPRDEHKTMHCHYASPSSFVPTAWNYECGCQLVAYIRTAMDVDMVVTDALNMSARQLQGKNFNVTDASSVFIQCVDTVLLQHTHVLSHLWSEWFMIRHVCTSTLPLPERFALCNSSTHALKDAHVLSDITWLVNGEEITLDDWMVALLTCNALPRVISDMGVHAFHKCNLNALLDVLSKRDQTCVLPLCIPFREPFAGPSHATDNTAYTCFVDRIVELLDVLECFLPALVRTQVAIIFDVVQMKTALMYSLTATICVPGIITCANVMLDILGCSTPQSLIFVRGITRDVTNVQYVDFAVAESGVTSHAALRAPTQRTAVVLERRHEQSQQFRMRIGSVAAAADAADADTADAAVANARAGQSHFALHLQRARTYEIQGFGMAKRGVSQPTIEPYTDVFTNKAVVFKHDSPCLQVGKHRRHADSLHVFDDDENTEHSAYTDGDKDADASAGAHAPHADEDRSDYTSDGSTDVLYERRRNGNTSAPLTFYQPQDRTFTTRTHARHYIFFISNALKSNDAAQAVHVLKQQMLSNSKLSKYKCSSRWT